MPDGSQLRLALELVAYELARHGGAVRPADPIAALEAVHAAADGLAPAGTPLCDAYEPLVHLATASLVALAALPEPDEIDGFTGLAGFEEWRRQRRT